MPASRDRMFGAGSEGARAATSPAFTASGCVGEASSRIRTHKRFLRERGQSLVSAYARNSASPLADPRDRDSNPPGHSHDVAFVTAERLKITSSEQCRFVRTGMALFVDHGISGEPLVHR